MNKIINIILSGLLWRKYKFFIVTLIITVVFMLVVGQVHQDYLRYNELQQHPSYVGVSFAVKWLVWLLSVLGFFMANHFYNKNKERQKDQQAESNSALAKLLRWKGALRQKTSPDTPVSSDIKRDKTPATAKVGSASDPFEHLRHKDKLRSYADVVIDAKNKQD